MNEIKRLLELSKELPEGLRADWEGTNHYELTAPERNDYFWLEVGTYWQKEAWSDKVFLERVGLLMDIAEALKKAEPMLKKLNGQGL